MKDYRVSIEKLRTDSAEAALIRVLATDPTKREMFNRCTSISARRRGGAGHAQRC